MVNPLTIAVAVAALALGAWCALAAFRDQPAKDWHYLGMAVVAVAALAQLAVGIVQLARGEKPEQGTGLFVAYLAGAALTVPAAGFMSLTERSRWGSATAAAGGVVLAVLQVRLYDIWGGHGG
jgi:peptidoglycan/LPS O-acetylase OafA/YrhL